MAGYKLSVTVDKVTVNAAKVWDAKMAKPATEALQKSLETAAKTLTKVSDKSKTMQQVPTDSKVVEFKLRSKIEEIALKGKILGAKVSSELTFKGKVVSTSISTTSKTELTSKPDGDVKFLLDDVGKSIVKAIKTQL